MVILTKVPSMYSLPITHASTAPGNASAQLIQLHPLFIGGPIKYKCRWEGSEYECSLD